MTMTREEEIREASIDYQMSTSPRVIGGDAFADFARKMNVNSSFIAGAKWADKDFANKVKKVLINYQYNSNLATKINVAKDMIYDELLIGLIQELKHNGLIEIKETQKDNVSTISMCVNVLKNDFKQAMEE